MADVKLTSVSAITAPVGDDLLYVVAASATSAVSRRVRVGDLRDQLWGFVAAGTGASVSRSGGSVTVAPTVSAVMREQDAIIQMRVFS